MKKIILSLSIAVSLFAASCNNAVNYNDTVVNLYSRYTTEMSKTISEANSNIDAAAKNVAIDRLDKLTDSCTTVMKDLKPSGDAEKFHTAVTNLYSAVKADFIPVYKKLLAINKPEDNVDEYNKLIEEVNKVSEKISQMENTAISAQREFAQKTNTRLQ